MNSKGTPGSGYKKGKDNNPGNYRLTPRNNSKLLNATTTPSNIMNNTVLGQNIEVKPNEMEQMRMDLQYFDYLKACFQNCQLEEKEKQIRKDCDQQLEKKHEELKDLKDKQEELKFKIKKIKLENELKMGVKVLKDVVEKSKIFESDFVDGLRKMTDVLVMLRSRLYLDYVDHVKAEAECAKIRQSLETINILINKYKEVTGDFDIVSKLGKNYNLLEELKNRINQIRMLEVNLQHFLLEKASDLLSGSGDSN